MQVVFDKLVDVTEAICQDIDSVKDDMSIFDSSNIDACVTENNPKYAKGIISQLWLFLYAKNLTLNPVLVIEAYAHRFKVECMFRELKQQIRGFHYHFWTPYIPKLNKYKKKSDLDPLSTVKEEHQESILR